MNNIEAEIITQKIKIEFSSLSPLTPDKTIIGIGEHLAMLAKESINIDCKNEIYVALGYYSQDLIPRVIRLLSFPSYDILVFNILAIEFLSDFILFTKNIDKDHFMSFFSKYMKNFEYNNHNHEAAQFYSWLSNNYIGKPEYDYRNHINLAGVGSIFLLLHEWVHTQKDLISSTVKMFRTPPTDTYFADEKEAEEIACDFNALAFMVQFNLIRSFRCTKEEMFEIAFLSIYSIVIYPLFSDLLIRFNNNSKTDIMQNLNVLTEITKTRFAKLCYAIKTAQNSNVVFSDYDILPAMNTVESAISHYLNYLAEYLLEDLPAKIEEYSVKAANQKTKYTVNCNASVWTYFC